MKVDACVFAGPSLRRNSQSLEQAAAVMERLGIAMSVVRPFVPPDYDFDRANRDLAAAIADDPRFTGFGRVNPWETTAAQQVLRAASCGLKGIHLHPYEENYRIHSEMVWEVVEAARSCGFPVYVSTGYPNVSEPLQLLELAVRFPDVVFIATHAAQLDISGGSFDDALIVAAEAPNVMYDLSGVYRRDFIEKLIRAAGVGKVVYGSCSPYMDCSLEIRRIEGQQIPQEQKDAIFGENIMRLLSGQQNPVISSR